MDVCQSKIPARMPIGQTLVIDSHQVQNRGVEVMNVDGVFRDVIANVIGAAVDNSGSYPASRQPA